MRVSLNFLVRITGMLVLAYLGARIGRALARPVPNETEQLAIRLLMLAGAGLGLLTTPRWTIEPVERALRYLRGIPIVELSAIVFGALLGLLLALLLAVPLGYLPPPFGQYLPIVVACTLGYTGAVLFSHRRAEVGEWLQSTRRPPVLLPQTQAEPPPPMRRFLLDTSAIIDGRIADVCKTGFVDGVLLVPRFVLNELQTLADSADELRRGKGRRGLEMLNAMQKKGLPPVEIANVDVEGVQQVDDKLIVLARQYHCPIITNDFNLARVAELQGVSILSLNQLADAMRPPVVPGQDILITIRDVGREREQGISFLDDGTMIVVEDARRLVGQTVAATVTRIYQTQTGRIVFAHRRDEEAGVTGQEPAASRQGSGVRG
jgi:uncharacterized protein YacL